MRRVLRASARTMPAIWARRASMMFVAVCLSAWRLAAVFGVSSSGA
jgi:hypothetical protein